MWTENSLTALNTCAAFRMEAERKEDNLCFVWAVKTRQQDGESQEAGWLHTLQKEMKGLPISSHPTPCVTSQIAWQRWWKETLRKQSLGKQAVLYKEHTVTRNFYLWRNEQAVRGYHAVGNVRAEGFLNWAGLGTGGCYLRILQVNWRPLWIPKSRIKLTSWQQCGQQHLSVTLSLQTMEIYRRTAQKGNPCYSKLLNINSEK